MYKQSSDVPKNDGTVEHPIYYFYYHYYLYKILQELPIDCHKKLKKPKRLSIIKSNHAQKKHLTRRYQCRFVLYCNKMNSFLFYIEYL